MTALAGYCDAIGGDAAAAVAARMLAAQHIYGRDACDCLSAAGGAFIGRALARRTAEDRFDQQPIAIAGGRYTLVADCRIDNRESLIRALDLANRDSGTVSDAAIVASAFDRWGAECFDRLRGDFAIAIWDATDRCFIMARDVFGNAPLFVHHGSGRFAFASMPAGLHALPDVERRADAQFCARVIAAHAMDARGSYWLGIDRVLPGHIAVLSATGLRQTPYWREPERLAANVSAEAAAARLRAAIDAAVSVRLRDGMAVATHLSAGLDSGAITGAAAARMRARGGRVHAFTAVPGGALAGDPAHAILDEGPFAAATAAIHANVDHVCVTADPALLPRVIEDHFALAQQPAINLFNLGWMHAILDAAKARGLTVLMPGDVGNYALSYDGAQAISDPVARGRWAEAARAIRAAPRHALADLRQWVRGLIPFRRGGHGNLSAGRGGNAATRLRLLPPPPRYFDAVRQELARVDPGPENKAALAGWGIDIRDPSADRDLFDLVASLPPHLFRTGDEPRALIRRAAADWIAPESLAERRRGLQAADWGAAASANRAWFADQVAAIRDFDDANALIDSERLTALVADWPAGGWDQPAIRSAYRLALMRGVTMGHFIRRAAGSNR